MGLHVAKPWEALKHLFGAAKPHFKARGRSVFCDTLYETAMMARPLDFTYFANDAQLHLHGWGLSCNVRFQDPTVGR